MIFDGINLKKRWENNRMYHSYRSYSYLRMGRFNWANKGELLTAPWTVIAPLLFFTISIFVLHMVIKEIKNEPYEPRKEKKEIDKSLFIPVTSKSIEKGS